MLKMQINFGGAERAEADGGWRGVEGVGGKERRVKKMYMRCSLRSELRQMGSNSKMLSTSLV